MKKIITIIILLFFVNANLFAQQPCNDEIIMNIRSNWKKRPDALMKTDYQAQVISRIDAISNFFKLAYPEPKGMEAGWYRTMNGNPVIKNGPMPYQFYSIYQDWYCNTNVKKLLLADETWTWAYAFVNDFSWFISDQYDLLSIKVNADKVFVLPLKKGNGKVIQYMKLMHTEIRHDALSLHIITRFPGNQLRNNNIYKLSKASGKNKNRILMMVISSRKKS